MAQSCLSSSVVWKLVDQPAPLNSPVSIVFDLPSVIDLRRKKKRLLASLSAATKLDQGEKKDGNIEMNGSCVDVT